MEKLTFVFFLGINASSLSLTAFTVERYIAICHPMKAQSVCTVKRAKKIVGGVWAFAFCYSSPWLGLTVTEPIHYKGFQTVERCAMKLSRQEYLVYQIVLLFKLTIAGEERLCCCRVNICFC
jgi:thyrotropin-releasing hormone receptor